MPGTENHLLAGATNDTWRTWLMTGVRRAPADRRRMRGANKGLKKMLLEGMTNGDDRPHAWKDFSGAMIRHAVDEAIRSLPQQDKEVVKLAYFGGYSNRDIASQVGLTEGTVQRRLRRALAAISEHIQHGRSMGRRAMAILCVWLSGRWLTDSAQHAVQAAVVVGAAAVIVAQPPSNPPAPAPAHSGASVNAPVYAPVPSSSAPASAAAPAQPGLPSLQPPVVQLPINLPVNIPTVPSVPIKTP